MVIGDENMWPSMELLVETRDKVYSNAELEGSRLEPSRELCLRAFESTTPDNVRVVILGQDPYHTPGKACGLAFAYHPDYGGLIDSSMANIIREFRVGEGRVFDTSLQGWVDQGVLLLNTCLTVVQGQPLSHRGLYWEALIGDSLRHIRNTNPNCIFVSWGSKARELLDEIEIPKERRVDTSHPSKYSAENGKVPFIGSKWYSNVNHKLSQRGLKEIQWVK